MGFVGLAKVEDVGAVIRGMAGGRHGGKGRSCIEFKVRSIARYEMKGILQP